jgi:hypothetical protein
LTLIIEVCCCEDKRNVRSLRDIRKGNSRFLIGIFETVFHQLLNILGVWNERSIEEVGTKELRRKHMNDHYIIGKKITWGRKEI